MDFNIGSEVPFEGGTYIIDWFLSWPNYSFCDDDNERGKGTKDVPIECLTDTALRVYINRLKKDISDRKSAEGIFILKGKHSGNLIAVPERELIKQYLNNGKKFKVGDIVVLAHQVNGRMNPTVWGPYKIIGIFCHPYDGMLDSISSEFPSESEKFAKLYKWILKEVDHLVLMGHKSFIYVVKDLDDDDGYMICEDDDLMLLTEAIYGKDHDSSADITAAHLNSLDSSNNESDFAPVKTTREQCLDDAKKCVCGDRDKQYGSPEYNFDIISKYWAVYLDEKDLEPVDVANMMCLFKLGRITTGATYDSYVDLAGYAACGAELR